MADLGAYGLANDVNEVKKKADILKAQIEAKIASMPNGFTKTGISAAYHIALGLGENALLPALEKIAHQYNLDIILGAGAKKTKKKLTKKPVKKKATKKKPIKKPTKK